VLARFASGCSAGFPAFPSRPKAPFMRCWIDTAYAPFGETYASAGTLDPSYTGMMNDTGHRQDTAGGLYDFPVREYSTEGRWPNPDPLGKASTCPLDPQTQNRYAYVRNNPMSYTDPTGGQPCDPFVDPTCGGGGPGCDPEDPFCSPCDFGLCYPFGPFRININSLIASAERPRPFPWPLLPPGFFGALTSGQTSACPGGSCARQAVNACKVAAGPIVVASVAAEEACLTACALAGPDSGFVLCAAGCAIALEPAADIAVGVCGSAAVAAYLHCKFSTPWCR
jgi:RHS repeat-associated protein